MAAGSILVWSLLLVAINVVVAAWNLGIGHWPMAWWSRYWLIFGIGAPLLIGFATFIWFAIGGVRDTILFFRTLRHLKRDATDDGRVIPTTPPRPSHAAAASSRAQRSITKGS